MLTRRSTLLGLIASPAIVRASSLMPVKSWKAEVGEELLFMSHIWWRVVKVETSFPGVRILQVEPIYHDH